MFLSATAFSAQGSDSMQKERIRQIRIERQQRSAEHMRRMNQAAGQPVLVTTQTHLAPHLQMQAFSYNQHLQAQASGQRKF